MKKKKLLSALILGGLALANAQDAGIYVAPGGNVYIQKETLVYSKGDLILANSASAVLDNNGLMKLAGNYRNDFPSGENVTILAEPLAANTNVASDGRSTYGQVMFTNTNVTSVGNLSSDAILERTTSNFTFIGTPLQDFRAQNLFAFTGGTGTFNNGGIADTSLIGGGNPNYYAGSVFKWDDDWKEWDPVTTAEFISPAELYMVARGAVTSNSDIRRFVGRPLAKSTTNAGKYTTAMTGGIDLLWHDDDGSTAVGLGGTTRNHYGLLYHTYISVNPGTNASGFVSTVNPYLSNIDAVDYLTDVVGQSNLATGNVIVYLNGSDSGDGSDTNYTYSANPSFVAYNVGSSTGDDRAKYVRPYQNFQFFVKSGQTANPITQANQTFNYSTTTTLIDRSALSTTTNTGAKDKLVLGMKGGDNTVSFANTYVTASEVFTNDYSPYNEKLTDGSHFIYTKESGKDFYINTLNATENIAKKIPVVLNLTGSGLDNLSSYAFTVDYTNPTGKPMYLKDVQQDEVYDLSQVETIDVDLNGETFIDNRFYLYYGEMPSTLSDEDITLNDNIKIFSNNVEDVIQVNFGKVEGTVKVYAYNLLGQLVHSNENVSALNSYKFRTNNKGVAVYLVKVVTESGKVFTKKVLK